VYVIAMLVDILQHLPSSWVAMKDSITPTRSLEMEDKFAVQ
tara:strand:+ start:485 stop:607 length:123 start_codon:yes stop_codon:yes gene_type:complete